MNTPKRIKNIVFDWSGTLSDDVRPVYETVMSVFAHFNVERITLEEFKNTFTLPYTLHFRMFGITASKDEVDAVFNAQFRNAPFPSPLPGVETILAELKSAGKLVIVFSGHRQQFLEEEAARFFGAKSTHYFDKLVGSVHDKEHAIAGVLADLNFIPAETLIVGDTEHDIAAGHRGKLLTAAVLSGYKTREQLALAKPDFIVKDVRELLTLGIF